MAAAFVYLRYHRCQATQQQRSFRQYGGNHRKRSPIYNSSVAILAPSSITWRLLANRKTTVTILQALSRTQCHNAISIKSNNT
jgi:hypothetical protein